MWNSLRYAFWIKFSQPQRKLKVFIKDGFASVPQGQRRAQTFNKLHIDSKHSQSRPICAKSLLQLRLVRNVVAPDHPAIRPHRVLFHTSSRRQIPPVLWGVFKPLAKIWAVLWGRYIRRWWNAMPHTKRTHYKQMLLEMKVIFFGAVALVALGLILNYFLHLQENPLTGRSRFISLTPDQIRVVAEWEEESVLENYKDKLLPSTDPLYKKISECVSNLLKANADKIKLLSWKLSVISDDETRNVFVLPNGHIFFFTGMMQDLKNEDQIAIILGHEMAHACMDHSIESISRAQVLDFFMIAILAAIWIFVPGDGVAIITQWFYHKLMKLMMELPYSRELELEADQVGLMFAARACYDVREAPALWTWQEAVCQNVTGEVPEFLSTHPAHSTRTAQLKALLPEAIQCREKFGCSKLSKYDPCDRVQREITALKEKLSTPHLNP